MTEPTSSARLPSTPRAIRTITARELRHIAWSPGSHVVAAVFMALQGMAFLFSIRPFLDTPQPDSVVERFFQGPLFWIPFLVLFPILTMRLFAEEQKLGTMEMLLTAPIHTRDVVAGKFLATFVFYAVLWIPSFLFLHLYGWITGGTHPFEPATLATTYALILSIGAMYLAVGCLASALTTSQIAAGIMTFGALMGLMLFGRLPSHLGGLADPAQRFFEYLNTEARLRDAAAGLFDTRPFIYTLSASFLLLAATGHMLNLRRWHS